jgi:transcriptional regulator with XRE-family HTH domain
LRSLHSQHYRRFATVITRARLEAGITQQDLAAQLRKPQSFVSKVERCERRLDVPEFILLARALGYEPADLLARIEQAMLGRLPHSGGVSR